MALPDFTGQNIEDTYQRVLQTDEGRLRDGTGSLVSFSDISTSIVNFPADDTTKIYVDGNNLSFEVNGSDSLQIYNNGINVIGSITASGNISASKLVVGQVDGFIKDGNGGTPDNNGILTYNSSLKRFTSDEHFTYNGQVINARTEEITLESLSGGIKLSGSISLTGNVTASGVIKASAFVNTSDTSLGLNLRGTGTEITGALDVTQDITATNITASGNISASGTIIASSSLFNNVTITPEGSYGGILDITSGQFEKTTAKFINTFNSTNNNTFAGYFQGGNANGTPGGTEKSYGIYTLAGDTNQSNPDSIALYAQSHEDGSPNSYAAIFSGSGGVVGINTLEPTEALHVVGNISASGTITAASFIGTIDGGSF